MPPKKDNNFPKYDKKKKASIRLSQTQYSDLKKVREGLISDGIATPQTPITEINRFVHEMVDDFDEDIDIRRGNDLFEEEAIALPDSEALDPLTDGPEGTEFMFSDTRRVKTSSDIFGTSSGVVDNRLFDGNTPLKKYGKGIFTDAAFDNRHLSHIQDVPAQQTPLMVTTSHPKPQRGDEEYVDEMGGGVEHSSSIPVGIPVGIPVDTYKPVDSDGWFLGRKTKMEMGQDLMKYLDESESKYDLALKKFRQLGSEVGYEAYKAETETNLLEGRTGRPDEFTVTDVNAKPNIRPESAEELAEDELRNNENGDDIDFYTDPNMANVDTDQSGFTRSKEAAMKRYELSSIDRAFGRNREVIGTDNDGLDSGTDLLQDIVESGTRVSGWFSGMKSLDEEDDDKFDATKFPTLASRLGEGDDDQGGIDYKYDDEGKQPRIRPAHNPSYNDEDFNFDAIPQAGNGTYNDGDYDFSGVQQTPGSRNPYRPVGPVTGSGMGGRNPPRPHPDDGTPPIRPNNLPIHNIPARRVAPRVKAPYKNPQSKYGMGDVRNFRKKDELYPYEIPSAYNKTDAVNLIRNDRATFEKAIYLLDP